MYEPRFKFNSETQNYGVIVSSAQQVAHDVLMSFNRDVDGKVRRALIDLGWCPPDVLGEIKAMFRANMLRHCQCDDVPAEIDRVLGEIEAKLGR